MSAEGETGQFSRWFRGFSLRAWLAVGFMLALLPLFAIAIYGYTTYDRTIATPFRDVLHNQHRILVALERMQDELWDLNVSVTDFSESGAESYRTSFETSERQVSVQLAEMESATKEYASFAPIMQSVEQQWAALLSAASKVQPGDIDRASPELQRFEGVISESAKRIGTIAETMRLQNEESHERALEAMRQMEIFAAIAIALAIFFAIAGIYVIDRALIASTDKLVEGAMRMANGERKGDIDVRVPPELASVANAFNSMTRQIKRNEEALATAAHTDGLTGLRNRLDFDEVLSSYLTLAREGGKHFGLLMIDIDHFKLFNDSYGHLGGDEALRQIAGHIASAVREEDRVFRYGGEEFAVILPNTRVDGGLLIGERVRAAVENHGVILPNGDHKPATVSVGVAFYGPATSHPEIVASADEALYAAKHAGRNLVRLKS
ncbi:diguanylate cyclase [Martelella alba]|uniref:diguanylate cyclase n=1 Tax=Martelella alba TaxID=2590451 RepID=A0A506UJ40_9HYPH|nr:GGDEF domain-containing protein [Martelella alba]TPW33330.1 diguanylate cyclase [Martelella alba]